MHMKKFQVYIIVVEFYEMNELEIFEVQWKLLYVNYMKYMGTFSCMYISIQSTLDKFYTQRFHSVYLVKFA